jgi:hypothetical protein
MDQAGGRRSDFISSPEVGLLIGFLIVRFVTRRKFGNAFYSIV